MLIVRCEMLQFDDISCKKRILLLRQKQCLCIICLLNNVLRGLINMKTVKITKLFFSLSCLMLLAACGSSSDNTQQLASWDNMYYYDVDMPK